MSRFSEILNGDVPVLIDFHATWCGPCQTMNPIIADLGVEMKGQVKFLKIDIDKNQLVAQNFGVRGVPTFVLIKKGKEVWRTSGVVPKYDFKQQLLRQI